MHMYYIYICTFTNPFNRSNSKYHLVSLTSDLPRVEGQILESEYHLDFSKRTRDTLAESAPSG